MCLFRGNASPSYKSGYHESWKRHFRNPSRVNFKRRKKLFLTVLAIESIIERLAEQSSISVVVVTIAITLIDRDSK